MTPATLSFSIFIGIIVVILFGIIWSMGGFLASLPMLVILAFGIVGTVLIAKRQGKTWKNFLDD